MEKRTENKKIWNYNFSISLRSSALILLTVLLFSGVFGIILVFRNTNARLTRIQQENLTVMADSIDHSLYLLLSRAQTNLKQIVHSDSLGKSVPEQILLNAGDERQLSSKLRNSLESQTTSIDRILVRKGDEVLCSTLRDDPCRYTFIEDTPGEPVSAVKGSDGRSFLALSVCREESGLTYSGLIPLDGLFEKLVVDSVNDRYWVVLYQPESGTFIQNEGLYRACIQMDREEALSRNDGFSLLVKCNDEGGKETSSYEYDTNGNGKIAPCIARCISVDASENGQLAISIHMDNSEMVAASRSNLWLILLFSLLIAGSGALLLALLLSYRRKQSETAHEVEMLREKAELTQKLLDNQTNIAHRQRLESLGILTAGIAHEFNNLLTPILGHSLMVIQNIEDENSPLFTSISEIYSAAQRAKNLVARIAGLTRRNSVNEMQELPIDALVRSALELTQPSQPENVELVTDLKAETEFKCNEVQMYQLLMNLIINAYHAMRGPGGVLTIKTAADLRNITITVSDTGPGIPDEEKEKVFDPFYTTKAPGKGTGLGLPLALTAVRAHGGTLKLTDTPGENGEPGHGATFTAVLPLEYDAEAVPADKPVTTGRR